MLLFVLGYPDSSVGKESACNAGDTGSIPGLGRSPGEGIGYRLQYSWASLGSAGKESARNAGDLSSISELGRSPGEGKGYPLQYSGLENSMSCSQWGHNESDTNEQLHSLTQSIFPPPEGRGGLHEGDSSAN